MPTLTQARERKEAKDAALIRDDSYVSLSALTNCVQRLYLLPCSELPLQFGEPSLVA